MSRNVKLRPETEEAIRQSNALLSEFVTINDANKAYWKRYHAANERLRYAEDDLYADGSPRALTRWQEAYAAYAPFMKSTSPNEWHARDAFLAAREVAFNLLREDAGLVWCPPEDK